ncbi:Tat pathway signal protein [Plastoroseomonas arctica]|uniref:Tat pathway signal protein n=1 Tax=Plastoroseomonas arctica TaxID=1509237 RepID=A0AAF1K6E4_9PROT|nr:Tat pathway signal protein [Plastoroseomonas arctica]MBR0657279.1 Tat pathway signal protein [Plastoroseomonas arctica]
MRKTRLAGLGLALAAGLVAPARAQETAPIRIELNRLEARPEGCRVWIIIGNPGAGALDPFRLDLVLFGRDGVVTRRAAIDAGPLPGDKTTARIFDLAGLPCDGIGSLLLNDILACGAQGLAPAVPTAPDSRAACLARLTLASRVAGIAFEK